MKKSYIWIIITIILIIIIIVGAVIYSGNYSADKRYMDISAVEAKELIDTNSNLQVIDVSPHYDEGHIPGAVHYYLGDGSLDDAIPTLNMSKDYLVYCHVDSAAISGAQKLVDAGFDPVYRLEGNYQAWIDAGYPIEY
jgi:rhodanese-related sulfurtransferase